MTTPDATPTTSPAFEAPLTPGQRVRVTQQIPRLSGVMTTEITGTIVRFGQSKTGSWYAHSLDDKLWLDRLELQKPDGERIVLNLDQHSRVEQLP